MIESLVILIIFAGMVTAIISPLIGLFVFFLIAYVRPQDFYPFLATVQPAQWILIITFISYMFHKLAGKEGFVGAKQNVGILGILLFILISRISAVDHLSWAAATQDFIRICLVYFLIINLLNTSQRLKNFFIFFVLVNLVVALRFYIAYKSGGAAYHLSKPGDASLGFLSNADDLGLGMVVAFVYALVPVFFVQRKLIKLLCLAMGGLFMLAALATQSRGAQTGLFAVFIAAILSQLRWHKLKNEKFRVGMVIALLLFAVFFYNYRWTLRESYDSAQSEADAGRMGRMATWTAARLMIKDKPLTGVGRGNFTSYWRMNYSPGVFGYQVAHNILYEVAAEIGILGLLCYLFFSLYGLKEMRDIARTYKQKLGKHDFFDMIFTIYAIGLIGFYVNGMFITVAFYWHIYVLVALFVCAKNVFMKELAYERIPRKRKQKQN